MTQLATFDYAVLLAYALMIIGVGLLAGRSNNSTTDLLLAGRSTNWLAVAASMYASFFSSISFLAMPAETFKHDWQYVSGMLTMPVAAFVAGYVFVEFFYRLNIFTVYQYAEMRFNNSVRVMLALLFILGKILYAGLVIYGGSLALSVATGFPLRWVIYFTGGTAIAYTCIGGLRAVIWTDVLQLFVMAGAIVLMLFTAIRGLEGGVSDVIRVGSLNGKFSFVGDELSLNARLTLPGVLIGAFTAWMSQKGVDQANAQLYFAGRSPKKARQSLLLAPVISIIIGLSLYFLGTTFWVYYQQNPDDNVRRFVESGQHDRIVPYFVINALPTGIRGVVIGGLLAAAMSTMDSLLNALATTSLVDFYRSWIHNSPTCREEKLVARGFILLWGAVITAIAAWLIPLLGESMIGMSNRIIGFAGGPILGVFLLGMFTRRASPIGVTIGALAAIATLLLLFIGGHYYDQLHVSFMLYSVIGIGVSVIIGYSASVLLPVKDRSRSDGLLWSDVVWRGWERERRSNV